MKIEQLRGACEVQPFRSFWIHLPANRSIAVRRRELIMLSPSGRTACVFQPDDSLHLIDVSHIVRLELDRSTA